MKISLNWLNEFVDLKNIPVDEIISRYALTTAEMEGYELRGHNIKGVIVGEIQKCERVPNSAKLSLLTVFDGKKAWQVICGAPNCREGMRVVYATVGSHIDDFKIGKATLAGFESNGMCLSAHELGISNDHDGIIELPANAPLGKPILDVLPDAKDIIIEIDNKSITHRPDLWGHYGIARELSVIFNRPLNPMPVADLDAYNKLPKIDVSIENKIDCSSLACIRVDNITLTKSPMQMQIRLFYLGMISHNFLVDLTNYVMLETGQPNHAFDARKIGKLSAGNVPEGFRFMTLRDKEIIATPQMMFIKSDGYPVGLAGVMGGKDSEIAADTQSCVFEFATFNAANIRKTAQIFGIRTDASTRYEKSLDTNLNIVSAGRILYLVNQYDKQAKVGSAFSRAVALETTPIKLSVNRKFAEKFCGVTFDWYEVTSKLVALGFSPVLTNDEIRVTVPTWRATKDVTCAADVVEEISRTYGYNNIIPVAPAIAAKPVAPLPMLRLVGILKGFLSAKYACNEVHTYLWAEKPSYLRVVNSCIKGCDWIRTEVFPSLLGAAVKNRANYDNIRIFEIGQVYEKNGENRHLSIVVSSKTKTGEELYSELANIVRDVMGMCGFDVKYNLGKIKHESIHPKNNASIEITKKIVGLIGIIIGEHPTVAAEINLSALDLQSTGDGKVKKISKYQKSTLDFTFVTSKTYSAVETVFDKFAHPLCMGHRLKDVYTAKDGTTHYTLQFTIGSHEKTLTSDEINNIWAKIIKTGRDKGLVLKE